MVFFSADEICLILGALKICMNRSSSIEALYYDFSDAASSLHEVVRLRDEQIQLNLIKRKICESIPAEYRGKEVFIPRYISKEDLQMIKKAIACMFDEADRYGCRINRKRRYKINKIERMIGHDEN